MKKLLAILGSVVVGATLPASLVSCSSKQEVNDKDSNEISLKRKELAEEINAIKNKIKVLKITSAALINENSNINENIRNLLTENSHLEQLANDAFVERNRMIDEALNKQNYIGQLKKTIEQNNEVINKEKELISRLEIYINNSELKEAKIKEFNNAKDKLREIKNQRKYIEDRIKKSKREISDYQDKLKNETDAETIKKLEKKITGHETVVEMLQDDYQDTEKEYKKALIEYNRTKHIEEIEFYEKSGGLDKAINLANININNFQKNSEKLNTEIKDQEKEINNNKQTINYSGKLLIVYPGSIANNEFKIKKLRGYIEDNNLKIESLNDQIKILIDSIAEKELKLKYLK